MVRRNYRRLSGVIIDRCPETTACGSTMTSCRANPDGLAAAAGAGQCGTRQERKREVDESGARSKAASG